MKDYSELINDAEAPKMESEDETIIDKIMKNHSDNEDSPKQKTLKINKDLESKNKTYKKLTKAANVKYKKLEKQFKMETKKGNAKQKENDCKDEVKNDVQEEGEEILKLEEGEEILKQDDLKNNAYIDKDVIAEIEEDMEIIEIEIKDDDRAQGIDTSLYRSKESVDFYIKHVQDKLFLTVSRGAVANTLQMLKLTTEKF